MNIGLYLKCDDNADNSVVADSSPNGNDAIYKAELSFDPPNNYKDTSYNHDADAAVGSGALNIMETSQDDGNTLIQVPDHSSIRYGTGDCSLSFRIKGNTANLGPNDRILYKGAHFDLYLGGQAPTRLRIRFGLGLTSFDIDYADIFDDIWHTLLILRNAAAGRIRVYLDGVAKANEDDGENYVEGTVTDIDYSSSDLFIGAQDANYTNSAHFTIDDVLLVDAVLTATQAAYLHDSRSDIIAMASEIQPVPAISSITDNNDGSITVAVTGSDTIQLYYRALGASSWTTGESRSGDGDITQTGLTLNRWYELYCVSIGDYHSSAPTAIEKLFVDNGEYNDIETAIYSILTGDDSVNALVGTRIYPQILPPEAAMPAIVYHHLNTGRDWTMNGPVNLTEPRFQINCFAATYEQVRDLANKVRLALNGYSGTSNGVKIWGIEVENEGDLLMESKSATQLRRYGKRLDCRIHFRES